MPKLYTYDPRKRKKVLFGASSGNILFRKVKPQHFMRINQAYGIQEIAFQDVCLQGIKKIVLIEEGTGERWEASIESWKENSKIADYGHGKQRFLSMKYQKKSHETWEEPE
jgi:hypothetical protein